MTENLDRAILAIVKINFKVINCYYIVILCKFLLTEVVRVNQTNLFTIGLRIRA